MLVCLHHLDPPVFDFARPLLSAPELGLTELAPAAGDPLPGLDGVDGIIVMGGAQSVLGIDDDPLLTAEAAWMRRALEADVPVLGVCLGAQLLAHVLGGRVFRLPRRMVSWEPLELTSEGAADPLLGAIPPGAHGLHWNEDGFTPPPGAVELLARGPGDDCRAFRHGRSTWGVQFHPEVGPRTLDHWYATWPAALKEAGVTEARAREGDRDQLGAQPALAAAIFRGFAAAPTRFGGHSPGAAGEPPR